MDRAILARHINQMVRVSGKVQVESELGKGATFAVILARAREGERAEVFDGQST